MNVNDFAKDKEIDLLQLDIECARQADRFFHWSQQAVEASFESEQMKFRLDVLQAKLEMECRQSPEDFGLVKPTEAGISAAVKCSEKYQKFQDEYLEARKTKNLLDAAVAAMEQKKRMLESLITLHGQQYFAGPSVPRDILSAWKEYQEGTEKTVTNQQKERIRKRNQS